MWGGGGNYKALNSYPLNRDCVVVYTYVRVKRSCIELVHYTCLTKYPVFHLMYWGINTCVQVQNLIKNIRDKVTVRPNGLMLYKFLL